jgi:hypothetical protein
LLDDADACIPALECAPVLERTNSLCCDFTHDVYVLN